MTRLCLLIITLGLSEIAWTCDIKTALQQAAAASDPNFPDGKLSILTHFSIACELRSEAEVIYVVDRRAVLTDMVSPRGVNEITFFSKDREYLGSLSYISSRPLWCEGLKLYLWGSWDGSLPGDNRCPTGSDCNVVMWDPNSKAFMLSHEKKYGSSGGVIDP